MGNKGTDLEKVIGSNPGGQKRLMSIAEGCISLLKIIVEKISLKSIINGCTLYKELGSCFLFNIWLE